MAKEYDFFMVYGDGCGAPTFRHDTKPSADIEAERLARAHPGCKFYVLHAVESFLLPAPNVIREMLDEMLPDRR